jgi:hypothetical protein
MARVGWFGAVHRVVVEKPLSGRRRVLKWAFGVAGNGGGAYDYLPSGFLIRLIINGVSYNQAAVADNPCTESSDDERPGVYRCVDSDP